jgi:hypothetical protein
MRYKKAGPLDEQASAAAHVNAEPETEAARDCLSTRINRKTFV